MNPYERTPTFDVIIRRLVEQDGYEAVAIRFGKSVRTIQGWAAGTHLPALTQAEVLAARLRRSAAYVRSSITLARDLRRKRNGG